jgi:hypothetical protein
MATVSTVVRDDVVAYFDEWSRRFLERVEGLTQAEYDWEPVPGAWSVRTTPDGPRVERIEPDPEPPPITTIAWRLWHIAVECLEGYASRLFGRTATDLEDRAFTLDVNEAVDTTRRAAASFRAGLIAKSPDWLFEQLGPTYGPYAESTFLGLVLHVIDELVHHGAEVSLLRDLYAAMPEEKRTLYR